MGRERKRRNSKPGKGKESLTCEFKQGSEERRRKRGEIQIHVKMHSFSGIWLHRLSTSLDWSDDCDAVHHSPLLCPRWLPHVCAQVCSEAIESTCILLERQICFVLILIPFCFILITTLHLSFQPAL